MEKNTYDEINEKLNTLRCLDINCVTIASNSHEYKMNPVVTEEEVLAFEELNNIKLPENYREFIKRVGNGGVSPRYEMYGITLGKFDSSLQCEFLIDENGYDDDVYKDECKQSDYECKKCRHKDDCLDSMYFSGEEQDVSRYIGGTLRLWEEGCTYSRILILNGKFKGEVWSASDGDGIVRNTKDFLEEYVEWLDASISEFALIKKMIDDKASFKDIVNQKFKLLHIDKYVNEEIEYYK